MTVQKYNTKKRLVEKRQRHSTKNARHAMQGETYGSVRENRQKIRTVSF